MSESLLICLSRQAACPASDDFTAKTPRNAEYAKIFWPSRWTSESTFRYESSYLAFLGVLAVNRLKRVQAT